MKKLIHALLGFFILAAIIKVSTFSTYRDEGFNFGKNYKVFALDIPKDLNFAGEQVPIDKFDVRENIDNELMISSYEQAGTLLIHKKANRWFPIIEKVLKKYNVPDDFKYIAVIESGLNNIVSPKGASGYWQFIESTGVNYGLEINEFVDERYSVERSTVAACKFFLEAYKDLKSWTLVAAAYNMGANGLSRQLAYQKVNSYYDLMLNAETSRYIFKLLAAKEILSKPKNYGYYLRKKDLYPVIPTKKIVIDSTINNLSQFALSMNSNLKTLKLFNPWLRQNSLVNPDQKKYTIEMPVNLEADFGFMHEAYDSLLISNEENHSLVNAVDSAHLKKGKIN